MSEARAIPKIDEDLARKIDRLQGPILVLGASGFVGANLLRMLLSTRYDVVGTSSYLPNWRLSGIRDSNLWAGDLLVDSNLDQLVESVRPRTVFNCVAYGAYSFEVDEQLIYETNFNLTSKIIERLLPRKIAAYVHAGSSSEYGDEAAAPDELTLPKPNSHYAVSKVASANLLKFHGVKNGFPCANLRLYSIYGPYEDSERLIPTLIRRGIAGEYPPFVRPDISRDFVYVDDACEAFVDTALGLEPSIYGESFNIGSGRKTTIAEVANVSARIFGLKSEPVFSMPQRQWDVAADWFADPHRAEECFGWKATMPFDAGLKQTAEWYDALEDKERYHQSSKKFGLDTKFSVSAIVACYKDNQAIPIMYDRLKSTFMKLGVEHEIIFVNDNSPDDSEEVIRALTRRDRRVVGITHSRNFGSQAAFRSGMEVAKSNACALLDGDLQDPPELIEQFVEKWRDGFDVVYGKRVKREAPLLMQIAYKLFYRIFDKFSYLSIPHDAGDFSLMDKRVVQNILRFPERDLFLRGVRAFVGFKQVGVDYVRPERMFGRSTNNLGRNIGWAKKGILSFSNTPLTMLSFFGLGLLIVSTLLAVVEIALRLIFPSIAPKGATTVLLSILFFGSINLFAVGLIGEYIAKIFEEVKQRPLFIRKSIVKGGDIRPATENRS